MYLGNFYDCADVVQLRFGVAIRQLALSTLAIEQNSIYNVEINSQTGTKPKLASPHGAGVPFTPHYW